MIEKKTPLIIVVICTLNIHFEFNRLYSHCTLDFFDSFRIFKHNIPRTHLENERRYVERHLLNFKVEHLMSVNCRHYL